MDILVIFILGMVVGSFLNVCIWRFPRGESIILKRSYCLHCKKTILWYDNIPIISYLLLSGKCRFCRGYIPLRYLIVEIITPTLFVAYFYKYNPDNKLLLLSNLIFCSYLILITFTDIEKRIIPDKATYPVLTMGIILCLCERVFPISKLLGALVLFGVFATLAYTSKLILRKDALGGGDIKLAAVIGLYLGLDRGIVAMLVGSILGSLVGITLILLKKIDTKTYLPFGPYLSTGAIFTLYFLSPNNK